MSKVMKAPPYWPQLLGQPAEVQQAHRLTFDALNQHEQAFAALKTQIDSLTASTSTETVSAAMLAAIRTAVSAAIQNTPNGELGGVNQQAAAYTIQDSDNGGMIVLSGSSALTVTLSGSVRSNWVGAIDNLTTAAATIAAPNGATVNGAASVPLPAGQGAWVFYDATNWWALLSGAGQSGTPTFTGTTSSTSATAGTATALPTAPAGYLLVSINGTNYKIPYYQP